MTAAMTKTPMHEIKSAAAILDEDIVCRSFVQGSSTLAYACLLIRRKKYELASHVLHSLEAKQASRFKDMVFYLQARIGIETGEFAMAKKRLLARVHLHPTDLVALSLLETCIYQEYEEWESANPSAEASSVSALREAPDSEGYDTESPDPEDSTPLSPLDSDPEPSEPVLSDNGLFGTDLPPAPAPAEPSPARSASPGPVPAQAAPFRKQSGDREFGIYQSLADDANTHALALWNTEQGRFKATCRDPKLETPVSLMPESLPGAIADACKALEAGSVHKICLSFQNLTLTSFHRGPENMGLLTGPIGHSLLSMVRAENVFLKASVGPLPSASRGKGDTDG